MTPTASPEPSETPLATFSSNPAPYIPMYVLLGLFFGVFATVFVAVPAFGIAAVLLEQHLLSPIIALYGPIALALLTLIGVVGGFVLWVYKNVQATEYRVYPDRIEEEGGWLTSTHQSIPVAEITNITYKQGLLGNRYGVGTVKFSTAGSDGKSMRFVGIKDAKTVYEDMETLTQDPSSDTDRTGEPRFNT